MRERIRPRQRGAMSRRSALNSAIKTPAHVYYFILVPGPPRLKRIHNYRCLREPLNLSRAPARTSLIYACVDFTPTPRSPESAPYRTLDCSCPRTLSALRIPVPGAPARVIRVELRRAPDMPDTNPDQPRRFSRADWKAKSRRRP